MPRGVGTGVTGKVVFIDGVTGGETRTLLPLHSPRSIPHGGSTDFGAQVATLGDLDGDNVPEYLVSAPGIGPRSRACGYGRRIRV